MMAGLSLLASMEIKNAGFPVGGSLEFARAIERRYLALGGEIHYKAQVQQILVENDRAVGVRLYDDSEHRADYVVSAADGRGTVYDLLGGRYVDDSVQRLYGGDLPVRSQVQVSLGVAQDLTGQPHWVTYLLDEPVTIAGLERHELGVKHYCFDPSLAPPGKSAVEVMLESPYGYWQRIYGRKLYDMEQLQVAEQVVEQVDKLLPWPAGRSRGDRRGDAAELRALHGQLAGRHQRLPAHQDDHAPPAARGEQDVARTGEFLHGRPVGGAGRQCAHGGHVGAAGDPVDLP